MSNVIHTTQKCPCETLTESERRWCDFKRTIDSQNKKIKDLKDEIRIKDEKIKSYKIRLSIVSVCKKCLKGQPYNVARYGGLCRVCV